jgi:hypothetical protein
MTEPVKIADAIIGLVTLATNGKLLEQLRTARDQAAAQQTALAGLIRRRAYNSQGLISPFFCQGHRHLEIRL